MPGCCSSGIGHEELGPAAHHRLPQHRPKHRMLLRRVGVDDKECSRLLGHIVHRVTHRSGSERHSQPGHGGRMAEPGAMVDITGQENLPGEFLQQIILLVGAFGRRHHAKSLRAGFVGDLDQSRGI